MSPSLFETEISRHIWETKYRYRNGPADEATIQDTWRRIARALARVEPSDPERHERGFFDLLDGFRFLPGGRIAAGAGTDRRVTLFNCFVMGVIEDSIDGIFEALRQGAITMQQGGGVGYDFSTLRPRNTPAHTTGTIASGPVSFMGIWDSMCATVLSTGARRGAMMATLRCDHPDVEEFIDAKRRRGELTRFNLSVQVSDALLDAVRRDADWPLVFPVDGLAGEAREGEVIERQWTGSAAPVPCRVLRRVRARDLWRRIMRATYDNAEPGVLFVDTVNRTNNLWYREHIGATNPCGEIPLPPYGACNLGSINLVQFVHEPFTARARLDLEAVARTAAGAVRFLDNVIDASRFPLPEQAEQAHGSRRIGLGVTGLADALILLGLRYDGDQAREVAAEAMRTICHAAYRSSIDLAREKGPFPFFDAERYLQGGFTTTLPADIRAGIEEHGIRNSHLLAIAPTGTISLLANNVSSGLEPAFAFHYTRLVLDRDGHRVRHELSDYAWRLWQRLHPGAPLPPQFVDAQSLAPEAHLAMQAALQPYVDNAVSKTINVPTDLPFERFEDLYLRAHRAGLKGCTTFRPNPVTGAVLETAAPAPATHCCTIEREAD